MLPPMKLIDFLLLPLAIFWLVFWAAYAGIIYNSLQCIVGLLYPIIGAKRVQIWNNYIVHVFWVQLTLFIEKFAGITYHYSGDKVKLRESAVVITNHQSFVDWLMCFPLAMRKGMLGCCNFFAKDSIKWIPGFGWGIWLKGSVMLKRNWDQDRSSIEKTFKHITDVKVPIWLIFHPEGTRFSPDKLEKSHSWSKKNNLPVYNHLLAPRTKGFVSTVTGISSAVDCIYDITIGYDQGGKIPGLIDLLTWNTGRHVHIHLRRFDIKDVPKDDAGKEAWLYKVWDEKEKLMSGFAKNGKFPDEYDLPLVVESLNI
jgi:1-acyl-sn-glycerol-3-phosphate acyltransferase